MKRAVEDSIDTLHKLKIIGKKKATQYKRATGTLHKGYSFGRRVYNAYKSVKPSRRPGVNPGPRRRRAAVMPTYNRRGRGRRQRGGSRRQAFSNHYATNNYKLVNPVSAGISAMRNAVNRNTRNSHSNHGGVSNITVPHKEIMDNIWTTGGVITPQLRYGNPLQTATCPFGSQMAACYGMMQWLNVVIRFKTAADMQTRGNIYIAAVLNVESFTLNQFKTSSGYTNTEDHRIVAAYQDFQMSVNLESAVKKLQTYGGSPTSIEDKTSVFGFIVVYGTDVSDDNSGDVSQQFSLGTLYIEYQMKLMQPRTALYMTSFVAVAGVTLGNNDGSFQAGPVDGTLAYLSPETLSVERSVFTPVAIDTNLYQWVFLTDFQGAVMFNAIGTGFTANPTTETMAFNVMSSDAIVFSLLTVAGDLTQQVGTYWIKVAKGVVVTPVLFTAGFTTITNTSLVLLPSGVDLTNGQPQVLSSKMRKHPDFKIGKVLKSVEYCPFNARRTGKLEQQKEHKGEANYEILDESKYDDEEADYLRFLYERSKRKMIKSRSPVRSELDIRNERLNGNNGSATNNDDHHQQLNGNHGSYTNDDDHIMLMLWLLIVVANSAWPTITTTAIPTRQPNTNQPTYAPRPINPRIGRVDYTLALIEGELNTPLSSYYETSPYPILAVKNATTLQYIGRYRPPLNITITLSITSVTDGYYSFKSAGSPTKVIGRNCVYADRQTGMYFWMIADANDVYLNMIPPAAASSLLGLLHASYVNNIPGFYSGIPIVGPTLMPTSLSILLS